MVNYQCQRCGFTTNHKIILETFKPKIRLIKAKLKEIPIKNLLCLHQLDKPKTNDDMSTQCQHLIKNVNTKMLTKK